MTASELLRQAKALIADEGKWWDGSSGRSRDLTCPCAAEAIWKIERSHRDHRLSRYMAAAVDSLVPHFNDTHTHAEVMAAFDKAIGLAERNEIQQGE